MEYGQKIGQINDHKPETNIRKALGVLQEDGVYAMFLWLECKDKSIKDKIVDMLNQREIQKYLLNNSTNFPDDLNVFYETLKEIAKDIDKLFFMKKILERTLTYALYHAKIGE